MLFKVFLICTFNLLKYSHSYFPTLIVWRLEDFLNQPWFKEIVDAHFYCWFINFLIPLLNTKKIQKNETLKTFNQRKHKIFFLMFLSILCNKINTKNVLAFQKMCWKLVVTIYNLCNKKGCPWLYTFLNHCYVIDPFPSNYMKQQYGIWYGYIDLYVNIEIL